MSIFDDITGAVSDVVGGVSSAADSVVSDVSQVGGAALGDVTGLIGGLATNPLIDAGASVLGGVFGDPTLGMQVAGVGNLFNLASHALSGGAVNPLRTTSGAPLGGAGGGMLPHVARGHLAMARQHAFHKQPKRGRSRRTMWGRGVSAQPLAIDTTSAVPQGAPPPTPRPSAPPPPMPVEQVFEAANQISGAAGADFDGTTISQQIAQTMGAAGLLEPPGAVPAHLPPPPPPSPLYSGGRGPRTQSR